MKILPRLGGAPNEIEVVTKLRRDVDLALRMAERLTHMGETGAAAAIVGEVAEEARELIGSLPGPRRSVARRRLSRTTVVGVSFVAALGAGSAAAIVGTQPDPPDARVRVVEPEFEPVHDPMVVQERGDAVEETATTEPVGKAPRSTSSMTDGTTGAAAVDDPGTGGEDPPDGGWKLPIDPPEIDPPTPLTPDD